jgi:hypothetical protein
MNVCPKISCPNFFCRKLGFIESIPDRGSVDARTTFCTSGTGTCSGARSGGLKKNKKFAGAPQGSFFKRIFAPTGKVCAYRKSSRLQEKFAPSHI